MAPFELEEPDSLTEALGLLDPEDPAVRPIAPVGGRLREMGRGESAFESREHPSLVRGGLPAPERDRLD
jgi:hypothetical protein